MLYHSFSLRFLTSECLLVGAIVALLWVLPEAAPAQTSPSDATLPAIDPMLTAPRLTRSG